MNAVLISLEEHDVALYVDGKRAEHWRGKEMYGYANEAISDTLRAVGIAHKWLYGVVSHRELESMQYNADFKNGPEIFPERLEDITLDLASFRVLREV